MEDQKLISITGKFTYVLFRSDQTMYTVAKFRTYDASEKTVTVTGSIPVPENDVLYTLSGSYVEHPRYGMQFQIAGMSVSLPSEKEGAVRYLSGASFPGVGRKTAQKIADTLGDDCLQQIRSDPECLRLVPGLSEKHIMTISEGIKQEDSGLDDLVRFLNISGIGYRNLVRLNRTYGAEALSKIRENPYRVIEECDGFGFATADKIAKSLGVSDDDERRLYALLVSACMDLCVSQGNSYVRYEALADDFQRRTAGLNADFDELLSQAVMKRQLIQEEERIYPVTQYDAEMYISDFLHQFPYKEIDPCDMDHVYRYLDAMQDDIGITYDDKQKDAIRCLFDNPVMIMTGGPGTGKTTVVRAMVKLFQMMYPSSQVMCAAPTGRAAKRLAELTGSDSATIHSLLLWDLETNTFRKNEDDPLSADLLIIDEFSMVDVWLFSNLLKACRNVRRICIIGDEDQLPSVGPGCVLRDLISSELFPLIRLDRIYRQEEGSGVISLAHDINLGLCNESYNDVGIIDVPRQQIKDAVQSVVSNAMEKGYSLEDIQVLSPMYSGAAGIDILNNTLQQCFNPPSEEKRELRVGYMTLREGDKILQLKNQPDDDVYNGDIGTLAEIITASESMNHQPSVVVDFQGVFVEYNQETFNNITLAYCISIHKSQGSEYPIVIMPITWQMNIMLQRKLLYTGITRARKALVILGETSAFRKGIGILDRHPRETTLAKRLTERKELF